MGRRVDCHGLGSDFAPLARALSARGFDLAMQGAGCDPPRVSISDATILWQGVDDPAARARALEGGAQDVVGPWMHEGEAVARIIRLARDDQPRLRVGDLLIHLVDRQVERAGRAIPLLARAYMRCCCIWRGGRGRRSAATRCCGQYGGWSLIPAPTVSRCICRGCARRSTEGLTGRFCGRSGGGAMRSARRSGPRCQGHRRAERW